MTEITLHCQQIPGWTGRYLRRTDNRYIKLIDPPESNPFPGVRVIGRTFIPDEQSNEAVKQGMRGAEWWFDRWRSFYESRSYVWAWEGPNEPQPMWDAGFRASLSEFEARRNILMHQRGWQTVAMNLSVGWTDKGHAKDLRAGLEQADYFGLHEYSAPYMQSGDGWYTLRYRRTVAELQAAGMQRIPPILITECGIDGGVINRPQQGWTHFTNEQDYANQLTWYGHELARDGVEAAFVFTAGWFPPWQSFDVPESLADKLPPRSVFGEPEPPPEPPGETMRLRYPLHRQYRISCDFQCHKNRTPPSTVPGIDIAAPSGVPVFAVAPGQVEVAEGKGAGGLRVWMNHGRNPEGSVVKSYYAHMDSICVVKGQILTDCDQIGTVGSTGDSTGDHLHLYIRVGTTPVDPEKVLVMP